MAKKYYKITKFHKMYFRFLKENGLMGKLNKERLMTRRSNPLLFTQYCRLGSSRAAKSEFNDKWINLVDKEYKRISRKTLSDFIESDATVRIYYKNLKVKEHLSRIASQVTRRPIQISYKDIIRNEGWKQNSNPFSSYFYKRIGNIYWQPYEVFETINGLDSLYCKLLKEKIANAE